MAVYGVMCVLVNKSMTVEVSQSNRVISVSYRGGGCPGIIPPSKMYIPS